MLLHVSVPWIVHPLCPMLVIYAQPLEYAEHSIFEGLGINSQSLPAKHLVLAVTPTLARCKHMRDSATN